MRSYDSSTVVGLGIFLVVFLILGGLLLIKPIMGIYPFGPIETKTMTVTRLYIDVSGSDKSTSSHYMVGTDKGVYEVDNSLWLWLWNADEIYAKLKQGETYKVTIKGNKMVNMIFQDYPGIISVQSVDTNPPPGKLE